MALSYSVRRAGKFYYGWLVQYIEIKLSSSRSKTYYYIGFQYYILYENRKGMYKSMKTIFITCSSNFRIIILVSNSSPTFKHVQISYRAQFNIFQFLSFLPVLYVLNKCLGVIFTY